jgi:hypothetical protein
VVSDTPSEADRLLGQGFAERFKPEISVNRTLAEALEDDKPEVRELAISALAAMGRVDLVLPLLARDDESPAIHATVIRVLREYAAHDPESERKLDSQLELFGGAEWARIVSKLLAGFTAEEAGKESTYTQLVRWLEHPDIGVRTLALGHLMTLTGRGDSLEYDPAKPQSGRGLEAWRQLLREGDLKPSTATPAAAP